jgi:hypothetical protein
VNTFCQRERAERECVCVRVRDSLSLPFPKLVSDTNHTNHGRLGRVAQSCYKNREKREIHRKNVSMDWSSAVAKATSTQDPWIVFF